MRQVLLLFGTLIATAMTMGQAPRRPPAEPKPVDDSCVMEGMVLRDDGVPLKNVAVNAIGQQVQSGRPRVFSVLTDAGGKFVITGMEPGQYVLEAMRPNFIRARYGQRHADDDGVTLSLRSRQRLSGLEFQLRPAAAISGRIFDEDGDVVVGARVTALRWGYRNGHRDLLPVEAALTDDRGEYRIHQLVPGRYFLHAALLPGGSNTLVQLRAVNNPLRTVGKAPPFVPTYYPSSGEVAGANEVQVGTGDQLSNISFRMIVSAGQHVSGWVRYSNGETARGVEVALSARLEQAAYGQPLVKATDEDGAFEFDNVYPGAYFLTSFGSEPGLPGMPGYGSRPALARMDLQVSTVEIKGIGLMLVPGSNTSAMVRLDSSEVGRSMASLRALRLALEPQDGLNLTNTAVINMRAAAMTGCVFRNVLDGDYTLRVSGLPDDMYISSLRLAGRDAQDNTVSIRGGRTPSIDVVLATNAGEVGGTVVDASDHPYGGARVVLVPEESLRKRTDLYKTITTDLKGNYVLKGVMPGNYKLFAWERIEESAYEDPEFLATYESLGVSTEVAAKGRVTVQLKAISRLGE